MAWTVEVTEEFEQWWETLSEEERVSVDGMIHVLEAHGPSLGSPYSGEVPGSRYPRLRQLRVPHPDRQEICVLYIPEEESASLILLTGTTMGSGNEPCPPEHVELADIIYGNYCAQRGR